MCINPSSVSRRSAYATVSVVQNHGVPLFAKTRRLIYVGSNPQCLPRLSEVTENRLMLLHPLGGPITTQSGSSFGGILPPGVQAAIVLSPNGWQYPSEESSTRR
ncbi:hypothetical protein GY45DRAFT_1329446 [Cubamyces sp. BRFM 1775]|nr:hypothetical protein GY45DRAFT_1329446 [Cubamyces sp. BRFM 1775]